tara:strand:- start:328 stop:789 length:462 start_codon:yes stop_codon:yes gene_type:complete
MAKLTTENIDIVDTVAIGTLTMLMIEIPTSANVFNYTSSVSGNRFTTLEIAKLGLSEIFSASILGMGTDPVKSTVDNLFPAVTGLKAAIKDVTNSKDLSTAGLDSGSRLNIEPLVYIDSTETNLIIDCASKEWRGFDNSLPQIKLRLTVIGRR